MSNFIKVERKKIEDTINYLIRNSRGEADKLKAFELKECLFDHSSDLPKKSSKQYKMTKNDWNRVVKGDFYVLTATGATALLQDFDIEKNHWSFDVSSQSGMVPIIVRKKGVRQIHFIGDVHPDSGEWVLTKMYGDENYCWKAIMAHEVCWDNVCEYICL